MHRSRDTAHAQWLKTHFQCYPMRDIMSHNSGTDKRRIVKLSGGVDHVTYMDDYLPRSKGQRSRSLAKVGHMAENGVMLKPSPVNDP